MSQHPAAGGGTVALAGGGSQGDQETDPSRAVESLPHNHWLLHVALRAALVIVGVVAVAAWLFIALSHLDDRYGVGHVQGAWMVLATYVNEGILYPPLYDGQQYGGTRWMPLPILVNALAARLTGEFLVSGKVVGVTLTVALLVLVLWVLRRSRCPWPLALALTGGIVATDTGRLVGSTLGGDVLPVFLQVGSLALFDRGQNRTRTVAAGLVAGLALTSKLTGVWAALAVLTWLLFNRRWRSLAEFGAGFSAAAGIVLGAVYVASDGRFLDSMLRLTFAGVGVTGGPLRPFNQFVYQLAGWAQVTWALLPLAVAGILLVGTWRRLTVYQLALGWAVLLLLGVFTDVGTGFNQLLDVAVLAAIAVGQFAVRLVEEGPAPRAVFVAVAVFVIWVAGSGIVNVLVPDVRAAVAGVPQTYPVRPLAGVVGSEETLLAEDPYVPLSLGRKPTVLDAFMLRRIDAVRPDAVDDLVKRIGEQAFDYVVLVNPLEEPDDAWWTDFHFGPRVMSEIQSAYAPAGVVDGYHVYRPRR